MSYELRICLKDQAATIQGNFEYAVTSSWSNFNCPINYKGACTSCIYRIRCKLPDLVIKPGFLDKCKICKHKYTCLFPVDKN